MLNCWNIDVHILNTIYNEGENGSDTLALDWDTIDVLQEL